MKSSIALIVIGILSYFIFGSCQDAVKTAEQAGSNQRVDLINAMSKIIVSGAVQVFF